MWDLWPRARPPTSATPRQPGAKLSLRVQGVFRPQRVLLQEQKLCTDGDKLPRKCRQYKQEWCARARVQVLTHVLRGRGERKSKTSKIEINDDLKEETLKREVEAWSSWVVFFPSQLSPRPLRFPPLLHLKTLLLPPCCRSRKEGTEMGTQPQAWCRLDLLVNHPSESLISRTGAWSPGPNDSPSASPLPFLLPP